MPNPPPTGETTPANLKPYVQVNSNSSPFSQALAVEQGLRAVGAPLHTLYEWRDLASGLIRDGITDLSEAARGYVLVVQS